MIGYWSGSRGKHSELGHYNAFELKEDLFGGHDDDKDELSKNLHDFDSAPWNGNLKNMGLRKKSSKTDYQDYDDSYYYWNTSLKNLVEQRDATSWDSRLMKNLARREPKKSSL